MKIPLFQRKNDRAGMRFPEGPGFDIPAGAMDSFAHLSPKPPS
jgi:hypothetical protein